ncbi:sulfotransferase family 2 domain-containing protein [Psychromonas arctica]|uniref:sulfotransferase family 2 domain-containing protein n=1 Tax=Psychromonas arctica TaxID=168275 RepID=UPI002FD774E4
MIINHDKKVVFIHIPKCAGKAVRHILCEADMYGKFWHWNYSEKTNSWNDLAHLPLHLLYHYDEWSFLREYKVIAAIRNPLDRFISAVEEHKRQHDRKITMSKIIEELDPIKIAYDPRYIHFCPQSYFTHYNGVSVIDTFLHQENLKNELLSLALELNLNIEKIKQIELLGNASTYANNVNQFNSRDVTKIVELYKDDFNLLGYPCPNNYKKEFSFENESFKKKIYKAYSFNFPCEPQTNIYLKLRNFFNFK